MRFAAVVIITGLLACVAHTNGQFDIGKGLELMKKAMTCFGKVNLGDLMNKKGGQGDPMKFMKGVQACKSQPMDQMMECLGRQLNFNSTVMNCLNGVLQNIKL
ncbi:uncharacterized protein LOC144144404 [Haemaphysalis longicornis]